MIIDGTLGNEKQARMLLDKLAAAGYDVKVADVEATQAVSEARTMGRWERGYLDAENSAAKGQDAKLGGRWVPQSFPASLLTTREDKESKCANDLRRARQIRDLVKTQLSHVAAALPSVPATAPGVDGEAVEAVRTSTAGQTPALSAGSVLPPKYEQTRNHPRRDHPPGH